ncbi:MAG: NDP-sugar synthase [Euryarchaeota archaeon]|nr:NDP-sugar synthase [Euryarchaeota archaeon]
MAGGKGQRLEPLTFDVPKPFLPVAGRPVVEWAILSLERAGITDIIVTTAYKREILQDHLDDGEHLGVKIRYAEEKTPLGTAGGVKNAEHLIDGPFVVMSGDVVADVDIGRMVTYHQKKRALATIALTRVDDPTEYGIIGLDDDGRIERFKEKPKREEVFSDLTNAGVYVVEREMLDRIPEDTKYDWSNDLWTNMVGAPLYGHRLEGYWKDVGNPRDLLQANQDQAARIGRNRFGNVTIETGATVDSTILMDGSIVDAGATVRDSLLMRSARVGRGSRVTGSVLGHGVYVGPGSVIEDCVLGTGVEVPDGVTWHGERRPEPSKEAKTRIKV